MKDSKNPTKQHRGQSNVEKLVTPEMRQDVVQLKQRLEEYAHCLEDLFHNLKGISDGIFRGQQFAECLLADDPFEARTKMRKQGDEELDGLLMSIDAIKDDDGLSW